MSIFTYNVEREDRFELSSTSKGNQIKWSKYGKFLKADSLGYESIAEVLATELEMAIKGIDYVDYSLCIINEEGTKYFGCESDIFTNNGDCIVSVGKILKRYLGGKEERNRFLKKYNGKDLLNNVVNICTDVTKIPKDVILANWSNIIRLDSIILNEDRHLNNISFIKGINGKYSLCPIFDNGLSFLSDTRDYPMGEKLFYLSKKVKAKPFNVDFRKQISYFSDYDLLHIDYDFLYERLNTYTVDFKLKEFDRSVLLLKNRLNLLKGVAWD